MPSVTPTLEPNVAQLPTIGVPWFFDPRTAGASLANVLGGALSFIFIIGGLTCLVLIIMGGFAHMTSNGDPAKVEEGRNRITWALIGLVILLATYAFAIMIETLFHFCLGFRCPIDLDALGPGN